MLLRLDSCVRRNDEGLSATMEPKFWDFAENDAVFCIMRHPRTQESRKNVHTSNRTAFLVCIPTPERGNEDIR